jgi:hypothetical protein
MTQTLSELTAFELLPELRNAVRLCADGNLGHDRLQVRFLKRKIHEAKELGLAKLETVSTELNITDETSLVSGDDPRELSALQKLARWPVARFTAKFLDNGDLYPTGERW